MYEEADEWLHFEDVHGIPYDENDPASFGWMAPGLNPVPSNRADAYILPACTAALSGQCKMEGLGFRV